MDNKVISMADAAYEILSGKKRAILFSALWNDVRKMTKAPKENVSNFYEDLTLDPRFVWFWYKFVMPFNEQNKQVFQSYILIWLIIQYVK